MCMCRSSSSPSRMTCRPGRAPSAAGRTSRTRQHIAVATAAITVEDMKNVEKPKRRITNSPKSGASDVETRPERPKMPSAHPRRSAGTISTTWM